MSFTLPDPAPLPLLSWVLKDVLVQKLEEAIDAASDDANALMVEQRSVQELAAGCAALFAGRFPRSPGDDAARRPDHISGME
jgi:hypothetical protein